MRWLLDNIMAVQKAVLDRRCLFGTVDTWILWVGIGLLFDALLFLRSVDSMLKFNNRMYVNLVKRDGFAILDLYGAILRKIV